MTLRFLLSTTPSSDRTSSRSAIVLLLSCILLLLSSPVADAQTWTQTAGPFGAVSLLASGGSTLYGGEEGGAVFVLNDDGNGWTKRKVADNTAPITALAASGDSVYAGTEWGNLYMSGDRGATWKKIFSGSSLISTLLVEGDTIFRAHQAFGSSEDGSIHRSYDGGATWTELKEGLPGRDVVKIIRHEGYLMLHSSNSIPLYRSSDNGATWTAGKFPRQNIRTLTSAEGSLYAASTSEIYRSTDLGDSWEAVTDNVGGVVTSIMVSGDTIVASTSSSGGIGRNFFGVAVDGKKSVTKRYPGGETRGLLTMTLHKGLLHLGTHRGVYRASFATAAAGEEWEAVNRGLASVHVTALAYDGQTLHATTTMGPRNANGGGIFSSDDIGVTWEENCRGLWGVNYHSVSMRGSRGIAGGDSGLALPHINSDLWVFQPLAPADARQPHIMTVYVTKKLSMLVGSEFGIRRGDVTMSSWNSSVTGLPGRPILSFTEQDDDIYVGTEVGIYRSQDNGAEWKKVTGFEARPVTALTADSRDIYAGTSQGVYRSSDRGVSWTLGADGLSSGGAQVNALVMQGSTVYAGTSDGIFRSTDKGGAWGRTDSVLNGIKVTSFAVGPNHLFAGTDGHGVFRTGEVLSVPEGADRSPSLLLKNHPNPWSGTTTIRFTLEVASDVDISLHDPLGRRVRTVLNERREAGEQRVEMDDTGLPPGVYYYTLRTGERIGRGKMILTDGTSR